MTVATALAWLGFFSFLFAAAGIILSRRFQDTLESYTTCRNSQTTTSTLMTLLASSLGAWILFSPAQAATWGGITAIMGYALGGLAARMIMIPLGLRLRKLMPTGHTLTEFAYIRYGRLMYMLTLLVMVLYMVVSLIAEITAMGKLVSLLAPVPLWVTASLIMLATLIYTTYGGVRATILTDKLQMAIILPLLAGLCILGWRVAGGVMPTITSLQQTAPELISLTHSQGLGAGLAFFIAVIFPGLFHQGTWQRVYLAQDSRAMRRGFLISGALSVPIILIMGAFGLVFAAKGLPGDGSVALFSVIFPYLSVWGMVLLIPLGMALVMSTADTTLNALSGLVVVDAKRLAPAVDDRRLLRWVKGLLFILAVPIVWVSAQGYSVLFLFLLADLVCAAAAVPLFWGLFTKRYDGRCAMLSTLAGIGSGLVLFPNSDNTEGWLLGSFLLAFIVPVVVIVISQRLNIFRRVFDNKRLVAEISGLDR